MNWIWTKHVKQQMKERDISSSMIESTLNYPDSMVEGSNGRTIYQKKIDGKMIRVITEQNKIITAYITNKIEKYMGGLIL